MRQIHVCPVCEKTLSCGNTHVSDDDVFEGKPKGPPPKYRLHARCVRSLLVGPAGRDEEERKATRAARTESPEERAALTLARLAGVDVVDVLARAAVRALARIRAPKVRDVARREARRDYRRLRRDGANYKDAGNSVMQDFPEAGYTGIDDVKADASRRKKTP